MTRRTLASLCSLLVVLGGGVGAVPARAAEPTPSGPVRWLSTGDSYSSGHGVDWNEGDCAQSAGAWGPGAAQILVADHHWSIPKTVFTGCTGRVVSDFYNRRTDTNGKHSLWEWTKEQAGERDPKFDVITLTFAGDDLGFGGILERCASIGCPSEGDLQDKVTQLLARDRLTIDDGGPGGYGQGVVKGSLADFYRVLASRHLTTRGRMVVLGYPRLFAPAGEWPEWSWAGCNLVWRSDAEMLGRISEQLDSIMRSAVTAANKSVGGRIDYVSAVDLFGGTNAARHVPGHELCGPGEDWLNGANTATPTYTGTGVPPVSLQLGSFHPNAAGHAGEAKAVADLLSAEGLSAPAPCPTVPVRGVDSNGQSTDNSFLALEEPIVRAACQGDAGALRALMGRGFEGPGGRTADETLALLKTDPGRIKDLLRAFHLPPVIDQGGATVGAPGDQLSLARIGGWQSWRLAGTPPTPSRLGNFVGNWYVHGGGMTIRADGTGTLTFEARPDGLFTGTFDHPRATLSVKPGTSAKAHVTVITSDDSFNLPEGLTFSLTVADPGLVVSDNPQGYPVPSRFCNPQNRASGACGPK